MKLTPKKFQSINERWHSKKSDQSKAHLHSAALHQAAYSGAEDSAFFRYVSCPLCKNDHYAVFHQKTQLIKYARKKWQNNLISFFVRLAGTEITSWLFTQLFRRPINLSGYQVVKCTNCGLLYRNPIYREKALQKVYNQGYLKFLTGDYSQPRVELYRYILRQLEFDKRTSNFERQRILDIGCGFGLFLSLMKSLDWEPYGLDFAEDCIDHAQQALGLENTFVGNLEEDTFEADFFDAVSLLSVAAHLNDPIGMFKKIHKILRPGGYLIVFTVNANSLSHQYHLDKWRGFSKNHLVFFDTHSITNALEMAGFANVEYKYDNRAFDAWSRNGTIPDRYREHFNLVMRKENLGDMLIVIATNGEAR